MLAEIPTLETERLLLRPWRAEDAAPFASLMADPAVAQFIGGPLSAHDAWRKLSGFVGHWHLLGYGRWALSLEAESDFIGYAGIDYSPAKPEPELNWALLKSAQKRGYATEAARAALSYAFSEAKIRALISLIAPDNQPSLSVANRLGARFERSIDYFGHRLGVFRHHASGEHT
jgi:RimJ/RimL family protein N-acetyltransferase